MQGQSPWLYPCINPSGWCQQIQSGESEGAEPPQRGCRGGAPGSTPSINISRGGVKPTKPGESEGAEPPQRGLGQSPSLYSLYKQARGGANKTNWGRSGGGLPPPAGCRGRAPGSFLINKPGELEGAEPPRTLFNKCARRAPLRAPAGAPLSQMGVRGAAPGYYICRVYRKLYAAGWFYQPAA